MVNLDRTGYGAAFALYKTTDAFFPLIGAVLLGEQDGIVYADNAVVPRQIYVEHAYGFSQIFGSSHAAFESDLERHLLIEKRFDAPKIRLYTPYLPEFLNESKYDFQRSFRQRFLIEKMKLASSGDAKGFEAAGVDEKNVAEIDRAFGVVGRFWRSPEDFVRKANAVVALHRGQAAAICYAAAQADRRVEIDVFTLPEFRTLGVGKFAVTHFVNRCFDQSLQPLWDCFSNNAGSMQLCRSVGFNAPNPPYQFFTINKQSLPTDELQ